MAKNFDAAEIKRVSDSCVKCGQCLPHCPTYRLSSHESQSPRGRLDLLRLAADASCDVSKSALNAIEDCLACAQCERHCPLHLPVTAAIAAHRASHDTGHSKVERISRHPQALARSLKFVRLMPDAVLAQLPESDLLQHIKHDTQPWSRARDHDRQPQAWIVPGCTGRALEGDTLDSLIKMAKHIGHDVQVLPAQCCGSLAAHRGHNQLAEREAALLHASVPTSAPAPVIHLNTGCRDRMTQNLPQHQVVDAIGWLHGHHERLRWRSANNRLVAVHWPCTSDQPHRSALMGLLGSIPGLSVRELNQNAGCCGAAGDHFERNPDRARAFRTSWMRDWLEQKEPLVLASNIGCTLFLGSDRSFSATIQHPLVFLASQLETSP